MLAAGRNDIWVTGDIWRFPTGLLLQRKLLNWSGGKWHSYTAPASLGSIATDGTGGLWAAEIPGMPTPGTFAHFTRGPGRQSSHRSLPHLIRIRLPPCRP
jgi:hypothetical protein